MRKASSSCRKSTIRSRWSNSGKCEKDSGPWKMANRPFHRTALLLLGLAGLWAAGLTSMDAQGRPPQAATETLSQIKEISAKAGRRITTVSIETSDPVAYLTSRPDPMTLLVDLRGVDASRAAKTLEAKGLIAGGSVEQVKGDDGTQQTRLRLRMTQPASHQVRSHRNMIYV